MQSGRPPLTLLPLLPTCPPLIPLAGTPLHPLVGPRPPPALGPSAVYSNVRAHCNSRQQIDYVYYWNQCYLQVLCVSANARHRFILPREHQVDVTIKGGMLWVRDGMSVYVRDMETGHDRLSEDVLRNVDKNSQICIAQLDGHYLVSISIELETITLTLHKLNPQTLIIQAPVHRRINPATTTNALQIVQAIVKQCEGQLYIVVVCRQHQVRDYQLVIYRLGAGGRLEVLRGDALVVSMCGYMGDRAGRGTWAWSWQMEDSTQRVSRQSSRQQSRQSEPWVSQPLSLLANPSHLILYKAHHPQLLLLPAPRFAPSAQSADHPTLLLIHSCPVLHATLYPQVLLLLDAEHCIWQYQKINSGLPDRLLLARVEDPGAGMRLLEDGVGVVGGGRVLVAVPELGLQGVHARDEEEKERTFLSVPSMQYLQNTSILSLKSLPQALAPHLSACELLDLPQTSLLQLLPLLDHHTHHYSSCPAIFLQLVLSVMQGLVLKFHAARAMVQGSLYDMEGNWYYWALAAMWTHQLRGIDLRAVISQLVFSLHTTKASIWSILLNQYQMITHLQTLSQQQYPLTCTTDYPACTLGNACACRYRRLLHCLYACKYGKHIEAKLHVERYNAEWGRATEGGRAREWVADRADRGEQQVRLRLEGRQSRGLRELEGRWEGAFQEGKEAAEGVEGSREMEGLEEALQVIEDQKMDIKIDSDHYSGTGIGILEVDCALRELAAHKNTRLAQPSLQKLIKQLKKCHLLSPTSAPNAKQLPAYISLINRLYQAYLYHSPQQQNQPDTQNSPVGQLTPFNSYRSYWLLILELYQQACRLKYSPRLQQLQLVIATIHKSIHSSKYLVGLAEGMSRLERAGVLRSGELALLVECALKVEMHKFGAYRHGRDYQEYRDCYVRQIWAGGVAPLILILGRLST